MAALALTASCSLIDSARDSGGADEAGGGDAGEPAGDAPGAGCEPGDRITGVAVFNASPTDQASACDVERALVRDGNLAGLDLFGDTDAGCDLLSSDEGVGGCGCVGVDFGAAYDLASIVVRAAPIGDACGGACDGGDCGTGHSFVAWFGIAQDTYTLIGDPDLTSDQLTDYELAIGQPARFAVVCREWWSASRDDVSVDSIEAVCDN